MAGPSNFGSALLPHPHPFDHPPLPLNQSHEIPNTFPELQWSQEPADPPNNPTLSQPGCPFNDVHQFPGQPNAAFNTYADPLLEELLLQECFPDAGVSRTFPEVNGHGDPEYAENSTTPTTAIWPAMTLPSPTSICNACLVLREISHTNGLHIWKLQLHGSIGMITHAVIEKLSSDFSLHPQYQTFDFCKESADTVKQFLVRYFEDRKQEGYIVLQDPLWEFYDAMSVGLGGGTDFLDIDSFFELPPSTSGGDQLMNQPGIPNQNNAPEDGNKPQKIPLSTQRERTGKLKLKDFAGYLHLPIEEAARRMNICPTVMKKICRRDGLVRWPYRKVRSIQRKIVNKSKSLSVNDAEVRDRAQVEILELQQQLANISEAFFG
ncbi:unnamed protein product [Cuscuta epithymum]|uniref:RWP-RK domain-containing protein n=2 Tax=Cuscuta epithymum TaxID=186058 RepID=A0AAV0FAR9_9ASTE|nr:unnamed protein product [Cuscuta epithymum]